MKLAAVFHLHHLFNITFATIACQQYAFPHWGYAGPILGGLLFLQFIIVLAIVVFANDVVARDDSHLCTAKFLASVIEHLGKSGSLLNLEEITGIFGSDRGGLRYGYEQHDGRMTVFVKRDAQSVSLRDKKFPESEYD
jgi:hypothetical protein